MLQQNRHNEGIATIRAQEKHKAPGFPGPFDQGNGQLAIASPLPAVLLSTVLQAPEGERMNYRLIARENQVGFSPRPCNTASRIAARSSGQTVCDTYMRFPVVGCFPTQTRSKRQNATVATMSHLAQCRVQRNDVGSDESRNSWCHFSIGFGSVVESGTMVTNC